MKKAFLITTISSLFLASCAGGWHDDDKDQFKQVCLEQNGPPANDTAKASAYCNCTLEMTMRHYKTMEEVIANKDSLAIRKESEDCRAKFLTP